MNREELEALREIQREFSAPFDPIDHDIRDLPGGKQWVFVPHHRYRIRACAIYPAIQIEFGDYNQTEKHTMVKCIVTILGAKREAWGVVETSPAGERGNCFDRATAEATKNALEMWGMGAYLDDQPTAARIMGQALQQLSQEKKSKFNSYCKSLRLDLGLAVSAPKQPIQRGDTSFIDAVGGVPTQAPVKPAATNDGVIDNKVTQKQLSLLHVKAKEFNIDAFSLKSVLKNKFGYDSAKDIDKQIFNSVLTALEEFQLQEKPHEHLAVQAPNTINTPSYDPSLLVQEIKSLGKRKQLTDEQITIGAFKYYGKALELLDNEALLSYRNRLSEYQPTVAQ